ncbi:MAG: hypothetical protein AB7I27_00255 [Bacteriovoracaceae bacterium]
MNKYLLESNELISIQECATKLSISTQSIYDLIIEDRVPAYLKAFPHIKKCCPILTKDISGLDGIDPKRVRIDFMKVFGWFHDKEINFPPPSEYPTSSIRVMEADVRAKLATTLKFIETEDRELKKKADDFTLNHKGTIHHARTSLIANLFYAISKNSCGNGWTSSSLILQQLPHSTKDRRSVDSFFRGKEDKAFIEKFIEKRSTTNITEYRFKFNITII